MASAAVLKGGYCQLPVPRAEKHHQPRQIQRSFTFTVYLEPRCPSSGHFALSPLQALWEPLMRKRRIVSITTLTGCHPRLGRRLFCNPGLAETTPPPIKAQAPSPCPASPRERVLFQELLALSQANFIPMKLLSSGQ